MHIGKLLLAFPLCDITNMIIAPRVLLLLAANDQNLDSEKAWKQLL